MATNTIKVVLYDLSISDMADGPDYPSSFLELPLYIFNGRS